MADILTLKKFEALSPFEIKDELINLAKETSKRTQSAFLNAGRGNPNWIATTPREGFFLLGQFAITESKRVMEHPAGVGGMEIVNKRLWSLLDGLGLADKLTPNPNYDAYYALVDFEFWARKNIGDKAVDYLKKHIHPLDLAFRLAEAHGIVLLNGGGFDAPEWSLRVSLANLPDDVYDDIGRGVRSIARGYRDAYEVAKDGAKV